MRNLFALGFTVALACLIDADASAPAAAATHQTLPCAKTTITVRKAPTGPAQYESGSLSLANGATLRLQGTKAEMYRVAQMAIGDAVVACYGPLKSYADAGPSRTITVLDLVNGQYYGALVGTWKAH